MRTRAPSLRQRVAAHRASRARASRRAGARAQRHRTVGRPHRPAHAPAVRRRREQDSRASAVRSRRCRCIVDRRRRVQARQRHSTATCRATPCCASSPVRCASSRRRSGIIGRYAGDEFVILLPHAAIDEAARAGRAHSRDGAPHVDPAARAFRLDLRHAFDRRRGRAVRSTATSTRCSSRRTARCTKRSVAAATRSCRRPKATRRRRSRRSTSSTSSAAKRRCNG